MKRFVLIVVLLICLGLAACGGGNKPQVLGDMSTEGKEVTLSAEEEPQIITYQLYFDVSVNITDEAFEQHSIELYLDGDSVHEFSDSMYYTELLSDVEEGSHEVVLFQDNKPVVESAYTFELTGDSTVSFSLDYQEELTTSEYSLSKSIADSAITYPDILGIALDEALVKLEELHFVNIHYESGDETDILNAADWVIESQNIHPGDKIDKAAEIHLTCKKVYYQLYFDLDFDENLILAKYDVELYLDDELLDTIPHGQYYTRLVKIKEGDHTATFYKNTDNSVKSEKKINITTDSTLSGRLHTNKNDIELNDFVLKQSIENISFEMMQVVGMQLNQAIDALEKIGFINIKLENESDIWDTNNWVVISQSVEPGNEIDKNAEIQLLSAKKVEYLTNTYLNLNVQEAMDKAEEMNNQLRFVDFCQNAYMDSKVDSMTDEEKALWLVRQASYEDDGSIRLGLVYTGYVEVPNVQGKVLSSALDIFKKAGFSNVDAVSSDNSTIYNTGEWKVTKQSVDAGKKVNANGEITLTVVKKTPPSSSSGSSGSSSSSTASTTSSVENDKILSELNKYKGKEVPELLAKLEEMGYKGTFTFETSGMDFTYLMTEVKPGDEDYHADEFIVRSFKNLDTSRKSVEVLINSKENIARQAEAQSAKEKLESKLEAVYAWQAVEQYGKNQFPYGFKLHYLTEQYAETARDENTWFLKAGCDVNNAYGAKARMVCEALVSGTNDDPIITSFYVY